MQYNININIEVEKTLSNSKIPYANDAFNGALWKIQKKPDSVGIYNSENDLYIFKTNKAMRTLGYHAVLTIYYKIDQPNSTVNILLVKIS
jgi:hypothetical protein